MSGVTPSGRRYEFDAELASRHLQQRGGFSMQRTTGREPPKRGYMVADFGSEHIVPGFASPRDIDEYRQANPNTLSKGRKYVGGWHDEGKTYLDQSRRVMSPRAAQAAGRSNAQRAVYALHSGKAPRVHYGGPQDVRGSMFEGQPEATRQLRVGNSDALRQQRELELRLNGAGMNAGRSEAHTPPVNYQQPRLPGMRGY